jgi:hypothetical protein
VVNQLTTNPEIKGSKPAQTVVDCCACYACNLHVLSAVCMTCNVFQNALAYFAMVVSYASKNVYEVNTRGLY